LANAGWYPDPLARAQVRYFDGARWSQWAADDGQSRLDVDAPIADLPDPPSSPPPGMPPPPPGAAGGWAAAATPPARFQSIRGLTAGLTWLLAVTAVMSAVATNARTNSLRTFISPP